jgi:dihydroxyacid dehydratase/phosphogluconate dehydratase
MRSGSAMGIPEEDCEKPKIAIVNSSSELAACYSHLDQVAKVVKEAIRAAGGVPFEIRTAAPSDFVTGAGARGAYMLARATWSPTTSRWPSKARSSMAWSASPPATRRCPAS